MSLLVDVQKKIHHVDDLIAELSRSAIDSPRPSTFANIRALEKEQKFLQSEFEHIANAFEEDVYRYRVLNTGRPLIVGLAESWTSFQNLFNATMQSLKPPPSDAKHGKGKKPKKTEAEAPTFPQFGYGYSFDGSVGVGLTLPRRTDGSLFDDVDIDRATHLIFKLAASQGEELTNEARSVGPKVVAAMHSWADIHARNSFGVGIEWRRDLSLRENLVLQRDQVVDLRDGLSKTTIESDVSITGDLVALDTETKEFRMKSDQGDAFEGMYTEAISREHAASLPARYAANIRKITKAVLEKDEDDKPEYVLNSLQKL